MGTPPPVKVVVGVLIVAIGGHTTIGYVLEATHGEQPKQVYQVVPSTSSMLNL